MKLQLKPSSAVFWLLLFSLWFAMPVDAGTQEFSVSPIMSCYEIQSEIDGKSLSANLYYHPSISRATEPRQFRDIQNEINSEQGRALLPVLYAARQLELVDIDHWFSFCLRNITKKRQNLVIEVGPPTIAEIEFYPHREGVDSFQTGSSKKRNTKDIPGPSFGFKVDLAPGETQLFSLRANISENPLQQRFYQRTDDAQNAVLQTNIWDRDSFDLEKNSKDTLFGIFIGILILLMIFHLLLFISMRELSSILYVFWSLSVLIVLISINGRMAQFITPNYPQLSALATVVFYPVVILLSSLFFKEFLALKKYEKINFYANTIMLVSALLFVLSYLFGQGVFAQMCDLIAFFSSLYFGLFTPVLLLVKERSVVAKYTLITLAPLILTLIDRTLFSFGLTDQFYVPLTIVAAAIMAVVLISYFTAVIIFREKQEAQRAAVEQLNISNALKSQYNDQLEAELESKTADIRSMNLDLKHKANRLLQMDESKSRFFANISHEFRTPLTLIEGPLKMLLEKETFQNKTTIQGVLKNSKSLKSLIDQILLLSEIDEQLLDLSVSEINIVQTVNELVAQFKSLAQQKEIELNVVAQQPVIEAYIDYEKLKIIINNLLSNAIKFTDARGQITVDVSSTAVCNGKREEFSRDEYVTIRVSDTGSGIPEEELPFVFDRYFQSGASQLAKSGVGTGIGLALVKELVDLHVGEVTVESTLKQEGQADSGTSFYVNLPLGRAHLDESQISADKTPSKAATQEISYGAPPVDDSEDTDKSKAPLPITVLVVDDNSEMRTFMHRLLQDDFSVLTAEDGLMAEEVMNNTLPDLVITDLMMPNRDGLEFVESIKKQTKFAHIPIIMLSARAGLQDRIKGLIAAVDDYLVKPFDGNELKVRIRNLLNKQAQFAAFYQSSDLTPEPINNHIQAVKSANQDVAFIDKVKAVVNQKLMNPEFSVEDLAHELHVSEATLRRRLAEEAQFTPAAFIRHCRLELARQLAEQGNVRSISELARSVGFSKPGYFASLYKKTFNTRIEIHDA